MDIHIKDMDTIKREGMEMQNRNMEYGFELIMDHLTGSTSDDLRRQLDDWRNRSDENEQLFVRMQRLWSAMSLSDRDKTFDSRRAYHLFRERVEADAKESGMARQIPLKPLSNLRRFAFYAAILIPFVFLSYFTYRYFTDMPVKLEEIPLISEIHTPNGSKTQMSLQDGSKVWLNSGSYIRYDSRFGRSNRTITLSGEAYFEVAKDEHSPFIVHVGDVQIKVLGTNFNVNAYSENNGVSVALIEGSVEMSTDKNNARLQPGNIAHYNAATGKIDVTTTQTVESSDSKQRSDVIATKKLLAANSLENALAWKDNRLIFNGESFEQIIATLERAYNVKVNIRNDQIKKRRFAGDFTNNETIEQIFNIMSVNGKFQYRINGNIIDVY